MIPVNGKVVIVAAIRKIVIIGGGYVVRHTGAGSPHPLFANAPESGPSAIRWRPCPIRCIGPKKRTGWTNIMPITKKPKPINRRGETVIIIIGIHPHCGINLP